MADQQSSPDGWDPQHCPDQRGIRVELSCTCGAVLPGTVVGDAEMVEQEALARSFLDA